MLVRQFIENSFVESGLVGVYLCNVVEGEYLVQGRLVSATRIKCIYDVCVVAGKYGVHFDWVDRQVRGPLVCSGMCVGGSCGIALAVGWL